MGHLAVWQRIGCRVFPRPFTHGGGGTSAVGQSVNGGGLMGGGHRPYGRGLTLTDYIINFISYCFQIRTITQHQYKKTGAMNRIM